jgi:HlyD family secretion protein
MELLVGTMIPLLTERTWEPRRRPASVTGTVLAAATLLAVAGCAPPAVESLWGSGMLEAEEVVIAPTVGGRLLARAADLGDTVEQGQVVAWIDSTALIEQRALLQNGLGALQVQARQAEAALVSARERYEQAVRQRDRLAALRRTEAVAQAQLDEAESAVVVASRQRASAEAALEGVEVAGRERELRLASLRRQIEECRLRAPRRGTVLSVYLEPGEVAVPGRGIVRIADLSSLYVRVYIPADRIGRVRLGGPARVRVDSWPDRIFLGRVAAIAEEAEFTPRNVQTAEARADLVFAVRVSVPNPDGRLKIGLPADVDLPEIDPYP